MLAPLFPTECELSGLATPLPDQSLDRSADKVLVGTADDPAYVIFTSGSTGRPKGAINAHVGVVNRLQWAQHEHPLSTRDRVLQKTPYSFDVSVWELFWPLMTGATMVVARPDGHRDASYLAELIRDEAVTLMHFVPSMLRLFLEQPLGDKCSAVRRVICSGEALSIDVVDRFFAALPHVCLANLYGPTEAAVDVTFWNCLPDDPRRIVPIGRPVANTRVYVLDDQLRLVPVGKEGELYIGGVQVGMGYVSRPDLTQERFLPDPFHPGGRMYKTGDVARWLEDGVIEYLGRADHQVKIRGNRIELGDIESALISHAQVARCVVVARDFGGEARLVAYWVPRDSSTDHAALKAHLSTRVPDYMLPQHFVALQDIPLLPNGKIDRNALPQPSAERPDLAVPFEHAAGSAEERICGAFAEVLDVRPVGRRDNFFDLGGNSLMVLRVLARLARDEPSGLSPKDFYRDPTPMALAQAMAGAARASGVEPQRLARQHRSSGDGGPQPIAIIGMAGRFPGADDVEAFWRLLCEGRDGITFFSADELDKSLAPELVADPAYVRARGLIGHADAFDAAFFGISAREAELMDPQQRVFMEICWECLERAGYAPDAGQMPVGVFAGMYNASYFQRHLVHRPDLIARFGEFQVMLANEKDYIATRVAHRLNLKGPAVSVHTACSTSLVAIAQAVENLRAGQCDMALAGGASITCPLRSGYLFQDGAMLSPDGYTRTFDAASQGTVFSDGASVVLLKRLDDALADGDTVWAVIRGVAVNNDGRDKASFTAPSIEGQAAVVAAALTDARVDAASISYVEAHGTATPIGDPVEIEGLTRAFRRHTEASGFCRIGSLKSNVGHMVTAAGSAGVIKTALALAHEQLPPTIHFDGPNPQIDFEASPFVVNAQLSPWPRSGTPRRAGVSSFGVGGTNAHAVLEEAPLQAASPAAEGAQLLLLSARSPAALQAMANQLAQHLQGYPGVNLADVAHTLQNGRSRFAHRLAVGGRFGRRSGGATAWCR